jgi:hypothetical protein
MKVQIFLEDKTQDLWRGKKLATIEVNPIKGYSDREVVNNAIKPIKYWLMGIYNQSLIVAINE